MMITIDHLFVNSSECALDDGRRIVIQIREEELFTDRIFEVIID